jgi:heme oxygenase (mycobilin-producing)
MKMYIVAGDTQEQGLLLQNENETKLIIESDTEKELPQAKAYEVLDAVGSLDGGFVVCNNIPVTEESRPVFEQRFQQRARLIEQEPGFQAIRVLRPLSDDTYVIMTVWENEDAFKQWQQSKAFEKAHKKRRTSEGVDQQKTIFPRPSFVTTYEVKQ